MADFCGLTPSNEALSSAASKVDASRKYAFTGDAELEKLYHSVKERELLQKLGYSNLL